MDGNTDTCSNSNYMCRAHTPAELHSNMQLGVAERSEFCSAAEERQKDKTTSPSMPNCHAAFQESTPSIQHPKGYTRRKCVLNP